MSETKLETAVKVLQYIKQGALACDQNGRLIIANEEAERLLGPLSHGQKLAFISDPRTVRPTGLFELPDRLGDSEDTVVVQNDAGENVLIRRLRQEGASHASGNLLLVSAAPLSAEEALRRHYSLSVAETAVAVLLLDGKSVEEIAIARGINPNTVRVQLKSIFAKSDTRSQAHFVSKAARVIYVYNA